MAHMTYDQAVTAMSWFVAALGVLFTAGAIIAGFIIWGWVPTTNVGSGVQLRI